jgi:OmcA/MtrC family decaheme c-type cytochrome
LPVNNVVTYCNLAATATCSATNAGAASSIVDLASCNKCHWQLSLHGSNRQGNLDVCTTCHNTEATANFSSTADFVAIDFKTMVHRIHNANYQVFSSRSGSVTSFDEVTYPYPGTAPSSTTPSTKLIACTACHVAGKSATTGKSTYFEPRAAQNGTSTTRGNTAADNLRSTKWYSTCGSCHRWGDAMAHMEGFGGGAGMTQAQINALNGSQPAPAAPQVQ